MVAAGRKRRGRGSLFVFFLSVTALAFALVPSAGLASTVMRCAVFDQFGVGCRPVTGTRATLVYAAPDVANPRAPGTGETNVVTVEGSGTGPFTITDTGTTAAGAPIVITISPGATDCSYVGSAQNKVRCTGPYSVPAFASTVEVHTGNRNDFMIGSDTKDLLDGGVTPDPAQGGFQNDSDTVSYADRPSTHKILADLGNTGDGFATITRPGGPENDSLSNIENLTGGDGADNLSGSQFSNVLVGGQGADILCGKEGFDTVDYSRRSTSLSVSLDSPLPPRTLDNRGTTICPGTPDMRDCVANDGSNEDLNAATGERDCVGEDIERVLGGSGNDTLVGNSREPFADNTAGNVPRGNNTLNGGRGDDTLIGLGGPDVFEGGDGTDTVSYTDRVDAVDASIDGAANDGGSIDVEVVSGRGDSIDTDVENVLGGSGADTLKGSTASNALEGGPGTDSIEGGDGDDTLLGGSGEDKLEGDGGNDSLFGQENNDELRGGGGVDRLDGGPSDDLLDGQGGPDFIGGGDGTDRAFYADRLNPVSASADDVAGDGEAGEGDNIAGDVEGLSGGSDNDFLVGSAGDGFFDGAAGDDVIDGGGGADTMTGGDGRDRVTYAGRAAGVAVNLDVPGGDGQGGENDDIQFDIEEVEGGSGNDTLIGDADQKALFGGPGNDFLDGAAGVDLVSGGSGNDNLEGGEGADEVRGDEGNDILKGEFGDDEMFGGSGDDSLIGGAGVDTFIGEQGNDTADYTAASRAVSVTLDGGANDGEGRERDLVRTDVESVSTGSGNDFIDSRDGVAGRILCGRGTDRVTTDPQDRVAGDCEVKAAVRVARCSLSRSATMSRKGAVKLRVKCPFAGKGRVTLQKGGRLGSKRFTIRRAGKGKTVTVKLSRKGKRAVRRRKRLRVNASVVLRRSGEVGASARSTTKRRLTIKAPTKRKRSKGRR